MNESETGTRRYLGTVIHDGFACGKALPIASGFPIVSETRSDFPDREINRLKQALDQAISDLDQTLHGLDPGSESHAIFSSHLVMLKDKVLLGDARRSIQANHITADYAWISVLKAYYERWKQAAKGSSMEQRSSDIIDIANRVYRILIGSFEHDYTQEGILVTEELSASDALTLDPVFVKGVVSERGNETSHSAILIRSKGIPVIFGIRDICDTVDTETWIAINGESGEVFVGYDADIESSIHEKKVLYDEQLKYYASQVDSIPLYMDAPVHLLANVSGVDQILDAIRHGAQGVGLFRTEFLFLNRSQAPSEEEQFISYREAIEALQGKKLVIRTSDFGGDKPISYLQWENERNPFLGKRGIRYSLAEASLLRTQMRALLRASSFGEVAVMFPMIATLDEVVELKERLQLYLTELKEEGFTCGEVSIGVMIEVPSAALHISELLHEVDFVSIGTNDLIQYVMAADRTLDTLSELTSSFQPAVLKLIAQIIQAAKDQGKGVAICGEMAGDARFTALLLAFGLKEFSMSADRIPRVKEKIASLADHDPQSLLRSFTGCRTAAEIKILLDQ